MRLASLLCRSLFFIAPLLLPGSIAANVAAPVELKGNELSLEESDEASRTINGKLFNYERDCIQLEGWSLPVPGGAAELFVRQISLTCNDILQPDEKAVDGQIRGVKVPTDGGAARYLFKLAKIALPQPAKDEEKRVWLEKYYKKRLNQLLFVPNQQHGFHVLGNNNLAELSDDASKEEINNNYTTQLIRLFIGFRVGVDDEEGDKKENEFIEVIKRYKGELLFGDDVSVDICKEGALYPGVRTYFSSKISAQTNNGKQPVQLMAFAAKVLREQDTLKKIRETMRGIKKYEQVEAFGMQMKGIVKQVFSWSTLSLVVTGVLIYKAAAPLVSGVGELLRDEILNPLPPIFKATSVPMSKWERLVRWLQHEVLKKKEEKIASRWNELVLEPDLAKKIERIRASHQSIIEKNKRNRKRILQGKIEPTYLNNILIYGPPGTGKTMFSEAFVAELHNRNPRRGFAHYMIIDGNKLAEYAEKDMPQAIKGLKAAERLAKEEWEETGIPTYIVIQDGEKFITTRGAGSRVEENISLGILGTTNKGGTHYMAFVITTNHLGKIDPAIKDRFPTVLEFNNLRGEQREAYVKDKLETLIVQGDLNLTDTEKVKFLNHLKKYEAEYATISNRTLESTLKTLADEANNSDEPVTADDLINAFKEKKEGTGLPHHKRLGARRRAAAPQGYIE